MPVKGKRSVFLICHGRRVNDWVFTILFFIIVPLIVFTTIFYAYLNQDLSTFIMPKNSKGEICGHGPANFNKSHLLILDYTKIKYFQALVSLFLPKGTFLASSSKCVEKCPILLGVPTVSDNICEDGITIETEE
ncbi:hypothetical protein MXB_4865, partial [Myxobolus squamalis]